MVFDKLEKIITYLSIAAVIVFILIILFYIIRSRYRPMDPESSTIDTITKERRKMETAGQPTIKSSKLEIDYDKMVDRGVLPVDIYPDKYRPFHTPQVDQLTRRKKKYSTFQESNRIRNKILQYSEYVADEKNGINKQETNDEIYSKILSLNPQNLEVLPFRPGLVFDFEFKNRYAIMKGVGITVTNKMNFSWLLH